MLLFEPILGSPAPGAGETHADQTQSFQVYKRVADRWHACTDQEVQLAEPASGLSGRRVRAKAGALRLCRVTVM